MKQKQINQEWRNIELGELAKIIAGQAPPSESYNQNNDGLPFLRVNSFGEKYPKTDSYTDKSIKECEKSDILLSVAGTIGAVNIADKKYSITRSIFAIRITNPKIMNSYLFSILKTKKEYFKKLGTGSSQKIITIKTVNSLMVPIPFINNEPDLEKQKQIVAILENLEKLKEKRKKTISLLDEYLKSVFNEMFVGKGFEEVELGKVAPLQGGFAFKSKDYIEKGINLVRINNVWEEFISWNEKIYLPENYLIKYKDFSLNENDLVLSMTRPIIKSLNSVKIAQIRRRDLPCLLNQRVGRFLIHKKRLYPKYLLYFCYTSFFKNQIEKYSSTSLQPNVSSRQINSIKISLPPISLQKEFASIVEKVEKLKEKQKQGLEKIEELFNSSLSKAFAGELI